MNGLIDQSSSSTIWCVHLIVGHNKGIVYKMMLFDVVEMQKSKKRGKWKAMDHERGVHWRQKVGKR